MRLAQPFCLSVTLLLTGCSLSPTAPLTPATGPAISGVVHGGQQPISGARVYLAAAGATAYGGPISSLLNSNVATNNPGQSGQDGNGHYYVLTDSNGNFKISGDYTCTSGQVVYVLTYGGSASAGVNDSAMLMAILGTCPSGGNFATSTPFITVNEVTTIAAAYAMAGFAVDVNDVSSSNTALSITGIQNAFANAGNLVSLATGFALATTPNGNGTVPQATINTLANILAACVNTNGTVTGGLNPTACYTLFQNAQSNAATPVVPTDTATAAINIAHSPAANVSALYNLQVATAPFAPTLGTLPNDFTLGISFTGGGLASSLGIAIDAAGEAWVTNFTSNSITKFSPLGAVLSGAGGYTTGGFDNPIGIAIDTSTNVWVANEQGYNVIELHSSGSPYTNSPYDGGIDNPIDVAIDASGNAWLSAFGNSVTKIAPAGASISTYSSIGGLDYPRGIAIDGSGYAWTTDYYSNGITALSNAGSPTAGSPYSGGGVNEPIAIAMDGAGNAWISNYGNNSVAKLANSGSAISSSAGYTGGGLNKPNECAIAIDGAGSAWIANQGSNSVTVISSANAFLSGANGFTGGSLNTPSSVAIDGSGDAWITNSVGATVTELIGAAVPVITPISAGLPVTPTANGTSNLGTRP